MKFNILFILVIFTNQLFAQDLHIYYDVHKDSIWYMKNGRVIDDPVVKKGKQVYFHLQEYNNYIYKASFEVAQYKIESSVFGQDSSNFKSLLPGILGNLLPGGSSAGLPFFNIPVFGSVLSGLTGLQGSTAARGELEDLENFKKQLESMEQEKLAINAAILEINKRKKAAAVLQTNPDFINTLCKLNSLAPTEIKKLVLAYFDEIFLLDGKNTFGLTDIPSLNEKLVEIPSLQKSLQASIQAYDQKFKQLNSILISLKNTDHGIDDLYPLLKKVELSQSQNESALKNLNQLVENAVGDNSAKLDYTPNIQKYYLKYVEINNNYFVFTHYETVRERYLVYTLQLYQLVPDSTTSTGYSEVLYKTKEVRIRTYGNTAFTSTMGLSGTRFNQLPQRYFLKGDKLAAQDADPYSLVLSSLFNLSFDFNWSVSPVLSLGIGVPVTNSEYVDNITFLVGPGVYVGRSQSILLSGGMMFSKVQRLTNGLQVGESVVLGGDGVIPTEKKYGLGYFFGLSYRISGK